MYWWNNCLLVDIGTDNQSTEKINNMWANPWGGGPIQQSAFQGMPNDQGLYFFIFLFYF